MSDIPTKNQNQPQNMGQIRGEQQSQYSAEIAAGQQHPMQGQHPQNPLANYQFSSEEIRVLKECNNESFFQRSIPFSAVLGFGTHMAVKNGLFTPNAKYGSIPKVVVSVIIGYFVGKASYQQKCAEKMMQLPNSKLGEILRQRKQGGLSGAFDPNQALGTPGFGISPFSSGNTNEVYDDSHLRGTTAQSSALDLDTERPTFGLDESQSFGDSNIQGDMLPLEPPKNTVTYEELRKSNRDNYNKRMQSNAPILPSDTPSIVRVNEGPLQTNKTDDNQNEIIKSMKKNQYGDVWSQ